MGSQALGPMQVLRLNFLVTLATLSFLTRLVLCAFGGHPVCLLPPALCSPTPGPDPTGQGWHLLAG